MAHPYPQMQAEYESWVANCRILPGRARELDDVAIRLTRPDHLARFAEVESAIDIPQVVQATICEREDGCDFTKSPAQGDPWNQVSIHVPRGIGPFRSWKDSAVYSWTIADALNKNSVPWSLPYGCFKWEGYNGFGPRAHGRRASYVVGGTNLQQPGKYVADGVWDPDHMDTQLGTLPIAMRMIELVPSLAFGTAIAAITAPSIVPAVAPAPASIGGGLTGTKWIQATLSLILHRDPPLDVDGSFGRETRGAVREGQALFGLPVTGLVDNALCDAIDAKLAAMRPAMA